MARNIVVLSPHFPPHYHRFWQQVKQAGGNALGIGDERPDSLPDELRSALTEYYYVPDMHDYDALVRACGYFTHGYGIKAQGRGGASIAFTDDAFGGANNPATMAFAGTSCVMVRVTLMVSPRRPYQRSSFNRP